MDNRRGFLGSLAAFFGLGATAKAVEYVKYPAGHMVSNKKKVPFVIPNKEEVQNYVMLMLGAPVLRIELDQSQLDLTYSETLMAFEKVGEVKGLAQLNKDGRADKIFKNMVLAHAKIMLGRLHSKYKDEFVDGDTLLEEGAIDLSNCLEHLGSI